MKNLKRVGWACVAGCCCVGLMALAGERSQGVQGFCPYQFLGQFNGVYVFSAFAQGADCFPPTPVGVTDNRMHELGDCGICPDPIGGNSHPLPAEFQEPPLVPQADPRFSGILR